MENSLQEFRFEGKRTRIVMVEGNPWWVAKDVCDVLGLSNNRDAIKALDDDERFAVDSFYAKKLGFEHATAGINLISESGLYTLIMRSTKPDAKKFRKWVTSEVLPAIRRTGAYFTSEAQAKKANQNDNLEARRVRVMERNANYRQAKVLLAGIECFKCVMTPELGNAFMAKYRELMELSADIHFIDFTPEDVTAWAFFETGLKQAGKENV